MEALEEAIWCGLEVGGEEKAICRSCEFVVEYMYRRYFCIWAEDDVFVNFASVLVSFYPLPDDWKWEGGGKVCSLST